MNLHNQYLLNTIVSPGFALGFYLMSPFLLGLMSVDVLPLHKRWRNSLPWNWWWAVTTLLARDVTDLNSIEAINAGNYPAGVDGTLIGLTATLNA